MNGPEHYAEAERLAAQVADTVSPNYATQAGENKADVLAAAQVHATLALAAATAASRTAWANPDDNYTATYLDGDWAGVTS